MKAFTKNIPFLFLSLIMLLCGMPPSPASASEEGTAAEEEFLEVEKELEQEEWADELKKKLGEVFLGPGEYAVSGAKHAQRLSESPSAITVLDRDDIRAYGFFTVEELLRMAPGVGVKQNTPSAKVIGIRGLHSNMGNTVLVLVDGREINLNLFGGVLWSLFPISLDDIERIEIIRGPGSSLYGANAFSGVINIVTRHPGDLNTATLISETGAYDLDFGTLFLKGKLAQRRAPISFLASADFDQKRSWENPDDTANQLFRTRLKGYYEPPGDLQATLELGYIEGEQSQFVNVGKMYFDSNSVFYADTTLRWKDIRFQGYYRRYDMTAQIITPIVLVQSFLERFSGNIDNLEGRVEYAHQFPGQNRLTVGGSFLLNIFYADVLVNEYNDEKRFGIFLQDEWTPVENLHLTLGFRFDYNSITDPSYSPRASAVYFLNPYHNLRFNFGQAFRKPSFFEYGMEIQSFHDAGPPLDRMIFNRDLTNAKISTYELGYQGHFFRRFRLDLTGFYSQYRDAIIFGFESGVFENFENYSDTAGVEVEVEAFLLPRLTGFFNYSHQNLIYRIDQDDVPFDLLEDFYPEHKANIGLRGSPWPGLTLSAALSFVSRNTETIMDPNTSAAFPQETDPIELGPHFIVNARAGYQFLRDKIEVGVKVFNLLNGENRQFPGLIWETAEPVNWGGEPVGRTITGFAEASF